MNKDLFFSRQSEEWETPHDFFKMLDFEFCFTLDPCCTPQTAKCPKFYTKEDDGLKQDWGGETVFVNPPYGRKIADLVRKASEESQKPHTKVVLLLPVRTDTAYFHDLILNKAEIRFVRGRLCFGGSKNSAPFPSMIVIFQ
jgi:site-specific DNA-methyltransferase (adenine-specific)